MYRSTRSGRRSGYRTGGRGSGSFRKSPVNVGDVVDVEIVELSRRGDGIARIRGFIIFVPNTKPGDKVKVRIKRVGRNYAVAELTSGESEDTFE